MIPIPATIINHIGILTGLKTKKKYIFRVAQRKDFTQIKNLLSLFPKQILLSPLPQRGDFLVVLNGGQVIGCCALEIYSKRLAEIRSLVVHPTFQKQGIGKRLVKACLKRARQKKVYEVLSITGAYDFFRNLGFKTFNREKFALLKVTGKK